MRDLIQKFLGVFAFSFFIFNTAQAADDLVARPSRPRPPHCDPWFKNPQPPVEPPNDAGDLVDRPPIPPEPSRDAEVQHAYGDCDDPEPTPPPSPTPEPSDEPGEPEDQDDPGQQTFPQDPENPLGQPLMISGGGGLLSCSILTAGSQAVTEAWIFGMLFGLPLVLIGRKK